MVKLNLPDFDYKLKKAEGKVWIFDVIRKKFIVLTPEEWVRQHFIHYLVTEKKYPRSLIRVEGGLNYNQLQKRSDIVVFGRDGNPWMIIECKSFQLSLSATTLQQVSAYNASLKASFISVTNGLVHYCASTDWASGNTELLKDFPEFEPKESSTS
jgi:type I site-specific restriction endonuclease